MMATQSTTGGILEGILQGVLGAEMDKQERRKRQVKQDEELRQRLAEDQALFKQNLDQNIKEKQALDPILRKFEAADYARSQKRKIQEEEQTFQREMTRKDREIQANIKRVIGLKDPATGKRVGGPLSQAANDDPEFAESFIRAQYGVKDRAKNKAMWEAIDAGDFRKAEKSISKDPEQAAKDLDLIKAWAEVHYALQQLSRGEPPTLRARKQPAAGGGSAAPAGAKPPMTRGLPKGQMWQQQADGTWNAVPVPGAATPSGKPVAPKDMAKREAIYRDRMRSALSRLESMTPDDPKRAAIEADYDASEKALRSIQDQILGASETPQGSKEFNRLMDMMKDFK